MRGHHGFDQGQLLGIRTALELRPGKLEGFQYYQMQEYILEYWTSPSVKNICTLEL